MQRRTLDRCQTKRDLNLRPGEKYKKAKMDIDEVFKKHGEFGPYQQKIFCSLAFLHVLLALHQVHNVFLGATPVFHCKIGKESILGCPEDGVSCDSYVFTGEDFTSVVSEFNLVCEDAYKADAIQSCMMLGILFGSLIFGYIADKYGRRKVVYFSTLGIGISTLAGIVAPNYHVYALARLFAGLFCGSAGMIAFALTTEVIGQSKRGFVGMALPLCFALGIASLALTAYFVRDWRLLSLVCFAPTLIGIYYYWTLPESPRWLYSQGRVEEAERLLEIFSYRNSGRMPDEPIELKRQTKPVASQPQPAATQIFKHPILRSLTLNNSFTWFVNCAVYYGLTMSSGNLGGNFYLSVALSGLIEIPSYFIAYFLMERIGRRYTYSASMLSGGLFCVMLMLVPLDQYSARLVLAVMGKMGISVSFCVGWLYAAEMYPTSIRNKAISVCNMMARIGGIVSPMIITFGKVHRNMDFVIFGTMTILAGFVCLKLPETLGKSMPETIADLETEDFRTQRSPGVLKVKLPEPSAGLSEEKLKLLQEEIEQNQSP